MRNLFVTLLLTLCINGTKAQSPYTYTKDGNDVILNGIITKYILINDPFFTWFKSSQQGYNPDSSIVNAMAASKNEVKYIVFGGTWCSDTHFVLPKFFRLQELSGVPDNNISFFAMDRSKKIIGNIGDAMGIVSVPTIIVMKDGKEVGRVIEYGKTGQWDKELAALLKN